MEREGKYRPILVCYNDFRIVSHKTREEVERMVLEGKVSWLANVSNFELDVYRIKLGSENPSNKQIAKVLNVSRNAVARARRRLAYKLGYKEGW